jgi:hypothetical protein
LITAAGCGLFQLAAQEQLKNKRIDNDQSVNNLCPETENAIETTTPKSTSSTGSVPVIVSGNANDNIPG